MPDHNVIIWGAGRIGRGYAADVFSAGGYRIVLVDLSQELIEQLRTAGRYTVVKIKSEQNREDRVIANYRALNTAQTDELCAAIAAADVLVVAVFPQHLATVARQLAAGIVRRQTERPEAPLDILLCTNMTHAVAEFRPLLFQALPRETRDYAAAQVGLVETVAMRAVSDPPPEERTKNPLLVWTDGFEELPVDRQAFKGGIPEVPGLRPVEDIQAIKMRKLYTYNMCHAALAYLGAQKGYTLSIDCLADPWVRTQMEGALIEVSQALRAEFHFTEGDTARWNKQVLSRTDNPAMGDTLSRLGADPRRKLKRDDRLVGAALLARRHGIPPVYLAQVIAAGFLFQDPADPGAFYVRQRVKAAGLPAALQEICELSLAEDDLTTMIERAYRALLA